MHDPRAPVRALTTAVGLAAVLFACTGREAQDAGLEIDAALVASAEGRGPDAALARLVRARPDSLMFLEQTLVRADAASRRRVVRALAAVDPRAAAPLLRHMKENDPAEEVRAAAAAVLTPPP